MQTHKVLETIQWIGLKFKPLERVLLDTEILVRSSRPDGSGNSELRGMILDGLFNAGTVLEAVNRNEDAVRVLQAFGLQRILDREFVVGFLGGLTGDRDMKDRTPGNHYSEVITPYNIMMGCARPLASLTIPPELQSEKSSDLLTIEVPDRPDLPLETIYDVLKATTALYGAVAIAYGHPETDSLAVVKIESGSGFTVSLKGVADVVKEFKNLFIEIWNKHRHKRADEIINHNRAVASSIEVLEHLETRVKKKSLQPEDAERLKRAIVTNTLSLFKNGALLAEIPHIEIVDNRRLLDGFNSPKLLTASEERPPLERTPELLLKRDMSAKKHPRRKRDKASETLK